MKRLLLLLLVVLYVPTLAQHKSKTSEQRLPEWSSGMVVLNTGDTLQCMLRYNRNVPGGALQVQEGDNMVTLTARDVKCFQYFDIHKKRERAFYTQVVLSQTTEANRSAFMEAVYGNVNFSILSHRTVGYPYEYMEYSPFKRTSPVSKKYILERRTGKLLPMSKENTLMLLSNKKTEVMSYIESHHIKFKELSDYITVLEYYTSL